MPSPLLRIFEDLTFLLQPPRCMNAGRFDLLPVGEGQRSRWATTFDPPSCPIPWTAHDAQVWSRILVYFPQKSAPVQLVQSCAQTKIHTLFATIHTQIPPHSGRTPRLTRETRAVAEEAGGIEGRQRRLLWWGGGKEEEPKFEAQGTDPQKNGENVAGEQGAMPAPIGQVIWKQASGEAFGTTGGRVGGLGGAGAGERLKKAMRPVGAKVPNVAVSETVDLVAPGEGLLWQPTSMTALECPGGGEPDGCDAIVRFCLMKIGEYQETPWKFPMAAMLQRYSGCSKADNVRAFRLSALRVSMFFGGRGTEGGKEGRNTREGRGRDTHDIER